MDKIEELLVCPECFGKLEYSEFVSNCSNCHINFSIVNGIPIMLIPDINDMKRINTNNIDMNKSYVIDYYSQVSKELESKYGRFIKFMNCGYVINENKQYSIIELNEEKIERNSIKLFLEVVGNVDCNNKRIIEIGCGRGGNIFYLNKFFKPKEVVGIDLCFENIISCDKRKHSNSFYYVADAENIPFASECFDIVINIESSFHYPDLFRFFRNVHRILKQSGYFLYADVLPKQTFQEMENYITSLSFEIIRAQDITSNVLMSFESLASSYIGINESTLNEFLAMLDSRNYRKLKEGEAEYRIYSIRKI